MPDGFAIPFQTAQQVATEEKKNRELKAIPVIPETSYTKLSGYLHTCWEDAKIFKQSVQSRMLSCAKARKGEYEDDKLAAIREITNGSEAYIRAVNTKCRAAYTNIYDIYNSIDISAWTIKPSPVPELQPDLEIEIINRVTQEITSATTPMDETAIMQLDERARKDVINALEDEAKQRAERMTLRIEDILAEGGWKEAFNQCLDDLVTYPAAILKGPILRRKPKKAWVLDNETGKYKLVVTDKLVWEFERVSPFDFYPFRNIENIDDGGCIQRLRLNRRKLTAMKGIKGYNDTEIDAVLEESSLGNSGISWLWEGDNEADEAEERDNMLDSPEGRIDGLEVWGEVSGAMLREWGMSEKSIPDENKEYQITAILINNHVVRCALNHNPLFKKPFHKVSWEKIGGAFWGQGIPEIADDIASMINTVARALANNIAFASGPILGVDMALLPTGTELEALIPLMIIKLNSADNNVVGMTGAAAKLPIDWFQPDMNASQLLACLNAFMKLLDEYTGIPAYTYGIAEQQGAGDTAAGLHMLMTAAGKIISNVASRVDACLVVSSIGMVYDNLMSYDPDESIKGDAEIVAGGASSVIAKGQQVIRLREFADSTKNETDMQILGLEGRAEILSQVAHALKLDLDHVIPDAKTLKAREQANQVAANMAKTANLDQPAPQNLDAAGSPVAGTDTAQFMPLPQTQ